MNHTIGPMDITDYDEVYALWERSEGIVLTPSDDRAALEAYLHRNQGMSFVARDGENHIVGVVLCGHDGARGYIRHLAVTESHRKHGIGQRLVERSLARLRAEGVRKCTIFVRSDNEEAEVFWKRTGWRRRDDLTAMSRSL